MRMIKTKLTTMAKTKLEASQKRTDEHYRSAEHKAWAKAVIRRANGMCQGRLPNGKACGKDTGRMFADHIIELRDDGAPFDVNNGQCLCASCHTRKTLEARRKRVRL